MKKFFVLVLLVTLVVSCAPSSSAEDINWVPADHRLAEIVEYDSEEYYRVISQFQAAPLSYQYFPNPTHRYGVEGLGGCLAVASNEVMLVDLDECGPFFDGSEPDRTQPPAQWEFPMDYLNAGYQLPNNAVFLGYGNHVPTSSFDFAYSRFDQVDFANTTNDACSSFTARMDGGTYYDMVIQFGTAQFDAEGFPTNPILLSFVGDESRYFGILPGTGQRIVSRQVGRVDIYNCGFWYVIFKVPDGK